jgi:hypothetical protein
MALLLVAAAIPAAEQRDFLSTDEADQIRLAQEPNERLITYLKFARQRLDLITQLSKEQRDGRAALMHDLIEQYTDIIDAIDTVADLALAKKTDISKGMQAVAEAEKEFLASLRSLRESEPADLEKYEFVLDQAIETTSDSYEAANEDLGKRGEEAIAREQREKKRTEALMQPKDLETKRAGEAKRAEEEKQRAKRPTLLKPGESVKKYR